MPSKPPEPFTFRVLESFESVLYLVLAIGVTLVILRAYSSVEREAPHPAEGRAPA